MFVTSSCDVTVGRLQVQVQKCAALSATPRIALKSISSLLIPFLTLNQPFEKGERAWEVPERSRQTQAVSGGPGRLPRTSRHGLGCLEVLTSPPRSNPANRLGSQAMPEYRFNKSNATSKMARYEFSSEVHLRDEQHCILRMQRHSYQKTNDCEFFPATASKIHYLVSVIFRDLL